MDKNDILYPSLDTPAILVDMSKLETNIQEMARLTAEAGVKLRPHAKNHLCPYIAKLQLEAGASGICVGKLGEAKGMADEGIDDIIVLHPFYGDHKLEALKKLLLEKSNLKLALVLDMMEQATAISKVGEALGRKIPVLLKINIGNNRFGVLPGKPAVDMAKKLCKVPGIEFVGIEAHEETRDATTAEGFRAVAVDAMAIVSETARMMKKERVPVQVVALGATPVIRHQCRFMTNFPEITEVHPGRYVFGDMHGWYCFAFTEETCALSVLATVVSTPTSDRAMIDGGWMVFSAYLPKMLLDRGWDSIGYIKGRPDLRLAPSQEVGTITLRDPNKSLDLVVGQRVEVITNHAALAVNLHDKIYGVRNGVVERTIAVLRRGLTTSGAIYE